MSDTFDHKLEAFDQFENNEFDIEDDTIEDIPFEQNQLEQYLKNKKDKDNLENLALGA